MRKLIRANCFRLFKDKVFIIFNILMLLIGLFIPLIHYIDNVKNDAMWTIDSTCFLYAFIVPVLLSIMISLFIGCEYSDGTIRNKIIYGHKRYSIYLSNFIVCSLGGFVLSISYLISHTAFGMILLGSFKTSLTTLIFYVIVSFVVILAYVSLFTIISMLLFNKSYSIASSLLLAFALLFIGVRITSALNEPEYYSGYSYSKDGETIEDDELKNPYYLSGTKREIYEFLLDFIPGGQTLQIANMSADNLILIVLYDGIIIFSFIGSGILLFQKKDLK